MEKWTKTDMVYLAKGSFWLAVAQGVSTVSAFFLSIAFANLLPKEAYGTYRFILSILSLLTIPTLSGINTALINSISRGFDGTIFESLKTKIRWGILGGVASLALSGYYFFHHDTQLTFAFLIAAFFMPIMDSLSIYSSILEGKKLFKISTIFSVCSTIFSFILMLNTLYWFDSVLAVIFTYLFANTFARLVFLIICIKKFKKNNEIEKGSIKYGKNLSIISILGTISSNLDKILIFHFLGAAQLAIYSIALAPAQKLGKVVDFICPIALPKFSAQDPEALKKNLPSKLVKFFLVSLVIVCAYYLLAPYMFKYLFPKYIASIKYSQIYAFILLLQTRALINTALTSQQQQKSLYIFSIGHSMTRLISLFILLPLIGVWGAILSIVIAEAVGLVISVYYFYKM